MASYKLAPLAPFNRQNAPSHPTATSLRPSPLRSAMTGDDSSSVRFAPGSGFAFQITDPLPRRAKTIGVPVQNDEPPAQVETTTSDTPSPSTSPMAGEAKTGPLRSAGQPGTLDPSSRW